MARECLNLKLYSYVNNFSESSATRKDMQNTSDAGIPSSAVYTCAAIKLYLPAFPFPFKVSNFLVFGVSTSSVLIARFKQKSQSLVTTLLSKTISRKKS